ncbi:MAG: diguanylate cyclase [Treponema sp.]|nr:diguanylate cyclase [Candidatus Treponema caballi]
MSLLSSVYLIISIGSLMCLWFVVNQTKDRGNAYYVLSFACAFVGSIGYFFATVYTTAEGLLLATKLTYLDGIFLPTFLFMCMLQICNIKIKRRYILCLLLIDVEILFSVFLSEFSNWHYISVEVIQKNGMYFLEKEYGPHHAFYVGYLIVQSLLPFAVIFWAFTNKKKISWIYTIELGLLEFVTIFVYVFELIVDLDAELLPFAILFDEICILLILRRMNYFDVTMANVTLSQIKVDGYAVLNTRLHLVSCDDNARKYFPELADVDIDSSVTQPFLRKEFEKWILQSKSEPVMPKVFNRNGTDIRVMVHPFYNDRKTKHKGYVLEVTDDTVNQEHIRHLNEILNTDALTCIENRYAFENRWNELVESPLSDDFVIVAADLNGLKTINDNKGHVAGDILIKGAAEIMKKTFGPYGRVYRTGGDEFAALIETDDLPSLAASFAENMNAWNHPDIGKIFISAGYAGKREFPDYSPDALQKLADKRMYASKQEYYRKNHIDRRR